MEGIELGKFHRYIGHRRLENGELVAAFEVIVHLEKHMATQLSTFGAGLQAAYDALKANGGNPPPPAPVLSDIILGSGKPAVFAGDEDDLNSLNVNATDMGAQTLTAALGGPLPTQPGAGSTQATAKA